MKATRFTNPKFDFSFVRAGGGAALRQPDQRPPGRACGPPGSTITELLATGAVDVVEPGEVQAALTKIIGCSSTGAPGQPEHRADRLPGQGPATCRP